MFLSKSPRTENVYPTVRINNLAEATGYPTMSSCSQFVVSNGKIVNCVSDQYGLLDNRNFFPKIEEKLKAENLSYTVSSHNIADCRFKVNFILETNAKHITAGDEIVPMISCFNTYDGSGRASARFGIYRKVCSNGLHIADSEIGFMHKHRGKIEDVVIPKIDNFLFEFINTEYDKFQKKFEVLAEKKIEDLEYFVERVCHVSALFKFSNSEKDLTPTDKALEVMNIIRLESQKLKVEPNFWLGYNAFNEYIHKHETSFNIAGKKDKAIFELISELN